MPDAVLLRETSVLVVWAALIVTVSLPDPPCVMVRVAGKRLVTVGGGGVTWTVLLALPLFSDTVMRVLPALTAVTGTGTLVCPLAKDTDDGTVATLVLALLTLSVPAAVGVGESVAVRVPVAPNAMVNGFGVSAVGVGRILVPKTLIVTKLPGLLATSTCTFSVFGGGVSVTVLSTTLTCCEKSLGPATWTPFTVIVPDEIRLPPLPSPLTMCRRNGSPTEGGTENVSLYWLGGPVVRRYCLGPKRSWSGVLCENTGGAHKKPRPTTMRTKADLTRRTGKNTGSLLARCGAKE
jgi:hypothetical protein